MQPERSPIHLRGSTGECASRVVVAALAKAACHATGSRVALLPSAHLHARRGYPWSPDKRLCGVGRRLPHVTLTWLRAWIGEVDLVHAFLGLQQRALAVAQIYTHIYPRGGIAFARVFDYTSSQEKMLISTAVKVREYKVHEARFSCALSSKHGGGRLSRTASFYIHHA